MAHYTLIARTNAGDGKFPFVNVQFSKNHRPIPIEGATYYLRPSSTGKRTPIKIGKDVAVAHAALIRMGKANPSNALLRCTLDRLPVFPPPRLAGGSPKPRESTLSAASRNRAGLLGLSCRRQSVRRKL